MLYFLHHAETGRKHPICASQHTTERFTPLANVEPPRVRATPDALVAARLVGLTAVTTIGVN